MTPERVKEQLQDVVAGLEEVRSRLLKLQASLPESAAERGSGDLEDMEEFAELRAVIGCVVEDSIRPAIDDLRDLAALARGPANE